MAVHTTDLQRQIARELRQWSQRACASLAEPVPVDTLGRVNRVTGLLMEAEVPGAALGELCTLESERNSHPDRLAEVVGFRQRKVVLASLDSLDGISGNTRLRPLHASHSLRSDRCTPGQVLDGYGRDPYQPGSGLFCPESLSTTDRRHRVPVLRRGPDASQRQGVDRVLSTGIRVLDGLITLGEGQRTGIFAGAGCGKSTLLGAIARNADVDAVVLALIGERGRELNEFLHTTLDPATRARTLAICATADSTAMERARAAFTATTVAEMLRDQGKRVLLLVDSITRYARAQRELGLSAGETAARGGYPPSVFATLPQLVERAGNSDHGSITAVYTVLMEQDSLQDPVADEMRSLLDGHIVLDREMAEQGLFPAVDVLASQSRLMPSVADAGHLQKAQDFRALANRYKSLELLVRLGEYDRGQDSFSDRALALHDAMKSYIRQDIAQPVSFDQSILELRQLLDSVPSGSTSS